MLRSSQYGLYGAVIAGLIAAPAMWNSVDKSVDLVVDGQARTVHTTAHTVGEVLSAEHLALTSHDLLAPAATTHVRAGSRIVLRRGRLLRLDIDGHRADVWTTAPTVSAALAELGYSGADFVSVSRARRLPLGVTDIAIRTPSLVTVQHDGRRDEVTTTDPTVGDVLADLGIALGPSDRLSVPSSSAVQAGETVVVQRVGTKTEVRTVALPYRTVRHSSSSLYAGQTKLVRAGKAGAARVTYSVVYLDGKIIGHTVVQSRTLRTPQTRVLSVGTKRMVARSTASAPTASAPTAAAPSPGTAQAIARQLLLDRGWGSDQFDCLVTLWNHESGWRVHASNPSGAYGIPQALPGSKMGSAGPDWQNNATTQITWGLGYIAARYSTPCGAWSSWQAHGWY